MRKIKRTVPGSEDSSGQRRGRPQFCNVPRSRIHAAWFNNIYNRGSLSPFSLLTLNARTRHDGGWPPGECALLCGASLNAECLRSQHSQAVVARDECTLSLAMEGVLERGVLALKILNRLGSRLPLRLGIQDLQPRRLPLELEHLQVRVRWQITGKRRHTAVEGAMGYAGRLSRAAWPSAGAHAGHRPCPFWQAGRTSRSRSSSVVASAAVSTCRSRARSR